MTRREHIKRERVSRKLTYYTNELRGRQDRLKQLTMKGAAALSRYDIEISFSGDADLALRSSKRMLNNQIRYFEKKILEARKEPKQMTLICQDEEEG
jgi:hypothetical protein